MRIRVIDAFTDQPFRGNPAAVCVLEQGSWPDEGWMRQVAFEMGLSETAFALPVDTPDADYALRWFTPEVETNLCGHATLATAHALHSDRGTPATVRFITRSGVLVAHSFADGRITLDFPTAVISKTSVPDGLVAALGVEPVEAYETGSLTDLLVVLPDADAVRSMEPDLDAVGRVAVENGIRGVIVTGPAQDYDFVSRFFSPHEGIPEDPVTGSAHTALTPYWAARLGKDSMVGLQASRRTGVVHVELHGDRVHLTGRAVTTLDGVLQVASNAVAGSDSGGPAGHQAPASIR